MDLKESIEVIREALKLANAYIIADENRNEVGLSPTGVKVVNAMRELEKLDAGIATIFGELRHARLFQWEHEATKQKVEFKRL